MEEPAEELSIINRNTIYDLTKDIINEILENTLFFITEMLTDKKEFDDAELIEDLPAIESNHSEGNEYFQLEKNSNNSNSISNNNSNDIFLNICAKKILKGTRLNIHEKLQIINAYKNNPVIYSIHKLSDILNVERSTISKWIKNEPNFLNYENKKKLNLPGQGKKSCIWDKENILIDYFHELRSENIAVNINMLIKKLYKISPELKEKSYNAVKGLLYTIPLNL